MAAGAFITGRYRGGASPTEGHTHPAAGRAALGGTGHPARQPDMIAHRAIGGADIAPGMAGPFDLVWGFASYLLPLAMLELYSAAPRAAAGRQIAIGLAMLMGSALILLGSMHAWLFMWSPHL